MLEKNKNFFCDAHFHYVPCKKAGAFKLSENWKGCSCILSKNEWEEYINYKDKDFDQNQKLFLSFGIHPQCFCEPGFNPEENLDFLEGLLKSKQINAVGECGFDFFTDKYKAAEKKQEEYFVKQLELAVFYEKPLVIHCRKANEKLFEYSPLLKKVPSVLFHSFMGSPVEANSLLKKGIKGYFSFGKQLFNNNKKVIACVKELPLENLLLETDAPYQYLKGENLTSLNQIEEIYKGAYELRNTKEITFGEFCNKLMKNTLSLYYE